MPTPPFIQELRDRVGTHPLWLSGVTAVVVRGDEVLMIRRADNGRWAPVAGIIEPGEHPADTAEREVLEEAGVVVEDARELPRRLLLRRVEPVAPLGRAHAEGRVGGHRRRRQPVRRIRWRPLQRGRGDIDQRRHHRQ